MAENQLKKLKMIIVSAESDLARDFEAGFGRAGLISLGIAATAQEAIQMVIEKEPDLLVMEPYLPGMNCDELTAVLESKASPYLVKLTISSRKQDDLASRFMAQGGDLFRLQPMDYRFTAAQVLACYEERRGNAATQEVDQRWARIGEILSGFGMRRSLKGFTYICDAAVMGMEDPTVLEDMKNILYPLIALKEGTNGNCVERCIRIAIEKIFKEGNLELLLRDFYPRADNGKVGNNDFIRQIIALYQKEEKTIG